MQFLANNSSQVFVQRSYYCAKKISDDQENNMQSHCRPPLSSGVILISELSTEQAPKVLCCFCRSPYKDVSQLPELRQSLSCLKRDPALPAGNSELNKTHSSQISKLRSYC